MDEKDHFKGIFQIIDGFVLCLFTLECQEVMPVFYGSAE
jgi:hypothetical protein